jgi:hypothetical protein
VVALGGTVVVADAGGVVVALGTVVVFNGIVSPGAVVDGNTSSPSTKESSVYLEAKQAPGVTGAVPIAEAMEATRTLRPASDG